MILSTSPRRGSWFFGLLLLSALLTFPRRADAYGWMIRHDYAACAQCHADPSGGGLLTPYGRAQSEVLLRTQYVARTEAEQEEPGKAGDFLFGAAPVPSWLLLGGDIRTMYLLAKPEQGASDSRLIWMQADLQGQVTYSRIRANASVGYADKGALPAALTSATSQNLVSRLHWIGVDIGEDKEFLLRAGRMNLPYGIRSIEHRWWTRMATRTDINDSQQHGISLAYNGDAMRGELMAIVGNLQLHPASYREAGYSGYFELVPASKLAVGVSSLVAHSDRDISTGTALWRHAHGLFGRYSPIQSLVLQTEANLTLESQPPTGPTAAKNRWGMTSVFQADYEAIQGVHLMGTLESQQVELSDSAISIAGWGSAAWFFAPHADFRADLGYQSMAAQGARSGVTIFLAQLHMFL